MVAKKPLSPLDQIKAKEKALKVSQKQQALSLDMLKEEWSIREELDKKQISKAEREKETLETETSFLKEQFDLRKELYKLALETNEGEEEAKKNLIEANIALKAGNDLLTERNEKLQESRDASEAIGGMMELAAGRLGVSVKQSEMWSKSFSKIGKSLDSMVADLIKGNRSMKDMKASMKEMGASAAKSIASFWTISDLLGNMVASTLEVSKNLRAVRVSLVQSGMSTKKAAKIQKGYLDQLYKIGISAGEYAGHVAEMYNNNAKLGETMKSNAPLFAKLGKLGFSTGDSMKVLNSRMFEFGETSSAALLDTLGDLAAIDENLDQLRGTSVKTFAANMQRLNQYGPRSIQVFSELAVVSKKTGMEMSKILDITSKFDTFEGAANMAQKLNVALGTSISSLELVGKTDVERAQIISQRLQDAGVDLENISPQLARVISQTGLEVGSLRRLAGADLSNVSAEAVKTSEDNTKLLKDVAKDAAAAIDPLDKAANAVTLAFGSLAKKLDPQIMKIADAIAEMDPDVILAVAFAFATIGTVLGALMASRTFKMIKGAFGVGKTVAAAGKGAKLFGKGGDVVKSVSTGKRLYGTAAAGALKKGTAEIVAKGATKGVGKKVAATVAGGAALGVGGALTKMGPKAAGVAVAKKVPVLGLILGAGFAIHRAMDGDYVGAAGELVAGGLSTIPGIGTAASIAIEGALMGRDVGYATGAIEGSKTSAANQLRDAAVWGATGAGAFMGPMGSLAAAGLAAKYVPGEDTSAMQGAVQGTAQAQAAARQASGTQTTNANINLTVDKRQLAKVTVPIVNGAVQSPLMPLGA